MQTTTGNILPGLLDQAVKSFWEDATKSEVDAAWSTLVDWLANAEPGDVDGLEDEIGWVKTRHILDDGLLQQWKDFFRVDLLAEVITWLIAGLERDPKIVREAWDREAMEALTSGPGTSSQSGLKLVPRTTQD
jgi:hypothetical protein